MRNSLLILTAAILFSAGCTSVTPDGAAAEKIAAHLDQDAMEYSVITAKAWQITFDRTEKSFRNALAGTNDRELLRSYLIGQMIFALSGASGSPGCGYSSKAIDREYIHSRLFLAADPAKPLISNDLLPADSIDTQEFIKNLPAGTLLALSADIKPEAILDAIGQTGDFANSIASKFPAAIPLRELAAAAAGRWNFTALAHDDYSFKLEIPDPEEKIFKFASALASFNRSRNGVSVAKDRLVMPGIGVVTKSDKNLVIYTTTEAEKRFQNTEKLVIPPRFAGLSARMPQKAAAVLYANMRAKDAIKFRLMKHEFISPSMPEIPEMAAISRNSDGILLQINGDTPMLTGNLTLLLNIAAWAAIPPAEVKKAPPAAGKPAPKKISALQNTRSECICQEELAVALEHREKRGPVKPGFYTILPDSIAPGKAGHGQFDLVCFGDIPSATPAILFISKPHKSCFCVAFADGKISKFALNNNGNFRRIISFLQTIRKYDEKVFRQMIMKADEFDASIKGETKL